MMRGLYAETERRGRERDGERRLLNMWPFCMNVRA